MTETARIYGGSLYDLAAEENLTGEILGQIVGHFLAEFLCYGRRRALLYGLGDGQLRGRFVGTTAVVCGFYLSRVADVRPVD